MAPLQIKVAPFIAESGPLIVYIATVISTYIATANANWKLAKTKAIGKGNWQRQRQRQLATAKAKAKAIGKGNWQRQMQLAKAIG